ncbi:hypothetical protein [Aureibacter tunicatorum]|uniref:DUF5004 domain-containing protein n=1 Tax=Aureibacter tunicatorum TaxID=866807 RepID=A0AAE4BSD3_9BACT|nr:hypothetical protein [Aureibacter tunicatorum]MDR6241119.1 hypothetical protein [Aureibacter tunicatorum]BDD03897.1 hypothetical protein AUTU_13800 [Aureibacter tunicatorum]
MKKTTTLLLLLLISTLALSQGKVNNDFTGIWTVQNANISKGLDSQVQKMMLIMKNAFTGSKFHFNENGKFKIELKDKVNPMMEEMTTMLNGQNWRYFKTEKKIEVGQNHLVMFVKKQDGKYYFKLSDTPLTLVMKKN